MKIGESFSRRVQSILASVPLLAAGLLICIVLSACGLRADPVAPSPYDDSVVQNNIEKVGTAGPEETIASEVQAGAIEDVPALLDAPSGLIGVYATTKIILTWDEMIGQGVRLYRVYRSEGGDYTLAGEAVTPVFNDKSIEINTEYYYRITVVGKSEGPPSEIIKVVTETQ